MTEPRVPSPLPIDAVLKRREAVVSSEAGARTYLMDARSGRRFALEDVGARVWALLESPQTVKNLLEELVSEFEVDAEACETGLRPFLEVLLSDGLLEVTTCERILPAEPRGNSRASG